MSGNGLSCRPEPPQRDLAPVGGRREAGAHVGERRRRRDRPGHAQPHERHLVAVEGDPVGGQQPGRDLGLALPEQLEVEVPDPLDRAHPVVGPLLGDHHPLQLGGGRAALGRLGRVGDPRALAQQGAPERGDQLVDGLQVALARGHGVGPELPAPERAQGGGVPGDVDRLGPQPRLGDGTEPDAGRPAGAGPALAGRAGPLGGPARRPFPPHPRRWQHLDHLLRASARARAMGRTCRW